jgi:HEAT repeat protein
MPDDPLSSDPRSPGAGDPSRVSGEDLLPPVQSPSAGFVVQLFVVPALIVLVIVGVWLMFGWLVHRSAMRPEDLIQGLQGSTVARWQRASELADMLRNERYADFKKSPEAAAKLAAILDEEIDRADSGQNMADDDVMLRFFLCRALGEFQVTGGLNVLVKAASTDRDPREQLVRRGAIQAIAVRAYNLAQSNPPQELDDPQLEPALFQLAGDKDDLVRSETAYALGQIGTPACIARLEEMVDDPYADARYNAAVALANHGDAAGVETLAEMLDVDELASVRGEEDDLDRDAKRATIIESALQAVAQLARQNPGADLSPVRQALKRVVTADVDQLKKARIGARMVSDAQQALDALGDGN